MSKASAKRLSTFWSDSPMQLITFGQYTIYVYIYHHNDHAQDSYSHQVHPVHKVKSLQSLPPSLPTKSKFKIISIHFRTQSIQHMALGTEEYTAGTWSEVVILMMMVVVSDVDSHDDNDDGQ